MTVLSYAFVFLSLSLISGEAAFAVQENGYRAGRNYYRKYGAAEGYTAFACALVFLSLAYTVEKSAWSVFGGAFVFFLYYLYRLLLPRKVKRHPTARYLRTAILSGLLAGGTGIAFTLLARKLLGIGSPLAAAPAFAALLFLCYPAVILSVILLTPYERVVQGRFLAQATGKLKESPNTTLIAITGSFGKTTVKRFLAAFLERKGETLATPNSYNTPMGIARCVNENFCGQQYFVMEFGARRTGDIRTLCRLFPPAVGVVTGVCEQHLSTFKTLSAVMEAKGELQEEVSARGGAVFFGSDNPRSRELYARCKGEKYLCGLSDSDAGLSVTLRSVSARGAAVQITAGGRAETVLLNLYGKHTVQDFSIAAAVAYRLGVSFSDIVAVAKGLSPTPHRMEVKVLPHCTVIDDSYNGNPVGAEEALSLLSCFPGRKIVVTPGLVEMGRLTQSANEKIGESIAKHADYALITARENRFSLLLGMKNGGFTQENFRCVSNGESLQAVIGETVRAGDTVLFLNDLPDGYI